VTNRTARRSTRDAGTLATRLVKSYLPVELVRQMDALILNSNGAFTDRSEFLAEAIADRLAEEAHGGSAAAAVVTSLDDLRRTSPVATVDDDVAFGDWLTTGSPITLPIVEGPATNFGLHNRDLPTIWALDWLGRLVKTAGRPIPWSHFVTEMLPRAWAIGQALQVADLARGAPIKSAAGFPTNITKQGAAEQRFLAYSVGSVSAPAKMLVAGRNDGPLFVFRLAGLVPDGDSITVAPTSQGVALLADLVGAGFGTVPPHSAEAWAAFSAHLHRWAPDEIGTWRRVLTALTDQPERLTLIERCDWWSGSTAETNSMSYIARGREWGLVEPKMLSGRYHLTDLGMAETARGIQTTSTGG
jgi:Arc/MetJ-type ribon-helix-helix transcriptional regulator